MRKEFHIHNKFVIQGKMRKSTALRYGTWFTMDEIEIREQKKKKSNSFIPLSKILHPKIVQSVFRDTDLREYRFIEPMK